MAEGKEIKMSPEDMMAMCKQMAKNCDCCDPEKMTEMMKKFKDDADDVDWMEMMQKMCGGLNKMEKK